MTTEIIRELAACKASDPYRRKPWAADQRGKWMTVNVPAGLWERIQAAAARAGVKTSFWCDKVPYGGERCPEQCALCAEAVGVQPAQAPSTKET
jgi:hypothetical protein